MKKLLSIFTLSIILFSCELLDDVENNLNASLTDEEIVEGLKDALRVGADSASSSLGVTDGYYGDALLKIVLPEEADIIVENLSYIQVGSGLIEDIVLGINRAAEDAAKDVGPIFWSAITEMSITDGWDILNGEDNAATQYLNTSTRTELTNLYSPKINTSLDSDLGLGFTALNAWEQLTGLWNTHANSISGQLLGHTPVNTNLGSYLTGKALDGLFIKVAEEEKMIRTDPLARVTDILEKVFGRDE